MTDKVREEIESFKLEYPNYDSEIVSEYVRLLDDFTPKEINEFLREIGY